jgi:hypothetical protein
LGEITLEIDRDRDLTMGAIVGDVPVQELVDALAEYFAGEPTLNVLLDFSEAVIVRLLSKDVRHLARVTRQYADRRAGGKTALVFGSVFGYGLGRMFEQLRHASSSPVAYKTFHDRAAALAWLVEP